MLEENTVCKGDGTKSLLLFQLGPVQDFIAQARSTRDLWSGSYMLSWLMAHAIKALVFAGGLEDEDIILPSITKDGNPLVSVLCGGEAGIDLDKALIPNLPNRCLSLVPRGREAELAKIAKDAITAELCEMSKAVRGWIFQYAHKRGGGDVSTMEALWGKRWDYQIKAFPKFTYAWFLWDVGIPWADAYAGIERSLAARRNTRDFEQWNASRLVDNQDLCLRDEAYPPKDSLSGKEECIGDETFWDKIRARDGKESSLFKAKGHVYGAINLVKRLWVHVDNGEDANYLAGALSFSKRDIKEMLSVPSIPEIAEKNTEKGNGYVAVLSMDGDRMGERLSACSVSPTRLREFSERLSLFALTDVQSIVAKFQGYLIYAGGDDVLAVLPSTRAIDCAEELREAFRNALKTVSADADVSCGIAVGHKNAPLQMLVTESRRMESAAKNKYQRSAVAISLYKRSGEIIEWGTKWDSGALDLMKEVTDLTEMQRLSARFPYALAALLSLYKLKGSNPEMESIIMEEVKHVISRQGCKLPQGSTFYEHVLKYLASTRDNLEDFINLFLAETFINRQRGEE